MEHYGNEWGIRIAERSTHRYAGAIVTERERFGAGEAAQRLPTSRGKPRSAELYGRRPPFAGSDNSDHIAVARKSDVDAIVRVVRDLVEDHYGVWRYRRLRHHDAATLHDEERRAAKLLPTP